MNSLLFIAMGGALGAVARHLLTNFINTRVELSFPLGTLSVNVIGSFLIGIIYVLIMERYYLHPEWKSVLTVGFLGAFTTFSTFSLESITLLNSGHWFTAVCYIIASVSLCLLVTGAAIIITRLF